MKAIEVYKTYLALKLHFTSEAYDYFKYKGSVNVNEEKFKTRKDRYFFEKLARGYSKDNLVEFFMSNFISNPKIWVGSMNEQNYGDWKRKFDALDYNFEKETKKIRDVLDDRDVDILFNPKQRGEQPLLFRMLLSKQISEETFLIFDKFFNVINHFDKRIPDDIVWVDKSFKLKKYKPFVQNHISDDAKYKRTIREVLVSNDHKGN